MSDLVKLLPENVANQIAAGEVVQRPASIVKELLENSVDAGATKIKLVVKDAGRLLVQVIDNGCGMSETDARMCFERHATSKIQKAEDLFSINTFGFRGEALPSIAAVAQVEMRTRRAGDEFGTCIKIEGSKVISQEPCTCDAGTVISVKNLFFNIPARRSFLKSNTQELKHIVNELVKVAMINNNISFALYNNDSMLFELIPETFMQRIVNLINKSYSEKIIPIEAKTEDITISGFIGKPEDVKKSRNTEQFFFVNGRFIKHAYLKHAIESSYQDLIPTETFPMYFVKIDINPSMVDINIHPTKTEVNFQDAHVLYAILKSAVKHSFGRYSMNVPSLDFEIEPSMIFNNVDRNKPIVPPKVNYNPSYNPFGGIDDRHKSSSADWNNFYQGINTQFDSIRQDKCESIVVQSELNNELTKEEELFDSHFNQLGDVFIQSRNKYIIGSVKDGIIIIDQERADGRIIYEKVLHQLETDKISSQIDMFPETITVNYDDGIILDESKDVFEQMGFRMEKMGQNKYVLQAHPADVTVDEAIPLFEDILNNIKMEYDKNVQSKRKIMAKATAKRTCLKSGKQLSNQEMQMLVRSLAKCNVSDIDIDGNPIYVIMDMNAVEKMF